MAKNIHQNTILGPIVTEKSIMAQSRGVYSFWVNTASTKGQISTAFTSIFSIPVLAVRTQKLIGKIKSDPRRRQEIKKSDRKRAMITVAKDQKIELLNLNTK
jgi:large subunit ribosomal protein L23